MLYADLEVIVQRLPAGGYAIDMRFRAEPGDIDRDLALNVPVNLDRALLLGDALDPEAYGRALTGMAFADQRLREAWITARTSAEARELPLRIRLRLDPADPDLHGIRWETVYELDRGTAIARSERFLLSRYLDSADLSRLRTPPREQVTALLVVASPRDLAQYRLAPFDATAEAERIRAALGDIPAATLVSGDNAGPVTLTALTDALRFGYSLLYVICHGQLVDGVPQLALEDETGAVEWVPGDVLARSIGDLGGDRRPTLVVLASCQSVGVAHGSDVPAALGPQLARAGVAAVLGMQGDAPLPMVARLMPRFLKHLAEEGEIDRALAVARSGLDGDDPWWMPVLFMRVRDGRLWRAAAAPAVAPSPTPVPPAAEQPPPPRRPRTGGLLWLVGALGLVALAVLALFRLVFGSSPDPQAAVNTVTPTPEVTLAITPSATVAVTSVPGPYPYPQPGATADVTASPGVTPTAATPVASVTPVTATPGPTDTPSPPASIATATPSATATPTATTRALGQDCPNVPLEGGFAALYNIPQVRGALGCALAAQIVGQAVIQSFEGGTLYWWGINNPQPLRDTVFVLAGPGEGTYRVFPLREVAALPPPPATAGPNSPRNSFGSVYYGVEAVREALGEPLGGEIGGDFRGALQRFEGGLMLWAADYPGGAAVFVLLEGDRVGEGRFRRYDDPNR
jgi:hypothetical protein